MKSVRLEKSCESEGNDRLGKARARTFVKDAEEAALFGEKVSFEARDALHVGARADEQEQEGNNAVHGVHWYFVRVEQGGAHHGWFYFTVGHTRDSMIVSPLGPK
jgi:hypothetical protein